MHTSIGMDAPCVYHTVFEFFTGKHMPLLSILLVFVLIVVVVVSFFMFWKQKRRSSTFERHKRKRK